MKVECSVCNTKYDVPKEQIGMTATCSVCKNTFVIQEPAKKTHNSSNGGAKSVSFSKMRETIAPYLKFAIFIGILVGGYYYLDSKGMLKNMPWSKDNQQPAADAKNAPAPDNKKLGMALDEALIQWDIERGFVFSKDKKTLLKAPKNIEKYTIPNGVTQIGDEAFMNCRELVSITIPSGVQKIGKAAFYNCEKLGSITLPDSVTEISERAFYKVKNIALPENHLTFMLGSSGELINHKTKTLVYLPFDFKGVYSVPKTVVYIGDEAFYGCDKMNGITLHEGVATVGKRAFYKCDSLRSVAIPDTVTEIGEGAFYGDVLVSISKSHPVITVEQPSGALINRKTKTLLYLPRNFHGHYAVPDNVIKIGDSAFAHCKELLGVTIPDKIITIGDRAFASCTTLRSALLPDSISGIGANAFERCSDLRAVTIPAGVTAMSKEAFAFCSKLTSVTMSDGVTEIGDRAFIGCSSLDRVTLPNSIKKIGKESFAWCTKLRRLTIPEYVEEIGDKAFYDCESLNNLFIPSKTKMIGIEAFAGVYSVQLHDRSYYSQDEAGAIFDHGTLLYFPRKFNGDYTIPSKVTKIASSAFYKCKGLKNIVIPNGVTKIENAAFYGCKNLQSIAIPEGVTKIEDDTFSGCESLGGVSIPEGVTRIGKFAFYFCKGLQEILIPEGVVQIGDHAFSNCENLQKVTLSGSVAEIDDYAFNTCWKLSDIMIPESVARIGDGAFFLCSSLKSLTIPGNVSKIGKAAFSHVGSVKVSSENTTFTVDTYGALVNQKTKTLLYFPSTVDGHYTVPEDIVSIEERAFSDSALKTVTIPEGVTRIGHCAFNNANNLQITLPESIVKIEKGAFQSVKSVKIVSGHPVFMVDSCGALIDMQNKTLLYFSPGFQGHYTVPNGVVKIGWGAFRNCKLTNITIPEGVVEIDSFAFAECKNLKNAVLPKSIKKVGSSAFMFAGCEAQVKKDYPHLFK